MIADKLIRRAHELSEQGSPYVIATVVRVQRPASVEAGSCGIVLADGTIEGFIGGVCAQHSVRLYSLTALESGAPLLLKIMPDGTRGAGDDDPDAAEEVARTEGAVTVRNPCLSGGAIEVFLEPMLPAPRVLVAGDSPIVGALKAIGPEVGLDVVAAQDIKDGILIPKVGDFALVVAAHGNDEVGTLRTALEAGLPYVGLVASRKRGVAVVDELRGDGVSEELVGRIETPAGLDIGARTPPEIALSIVARIVELRRSATPRTSAAPVTAVDPICGMTVVVADDTSSVEHDGDIVYFCGEGCRKKFQESHASAAG